MKHSTAQNKQPQRTCVGCRLPDDQSRLLRAVALATGCLQFDQAGWRSTGRGCYVHRQESCLQAAARGGFARSLRRSLRLRNDQIQALLALSEKTA